MDVGIYETGADRPAAQIHDLVGFVLAKADHFPVIDGNVGGMDLAGKDIHQPGILEHQVGWFFAPGDSDGLF